MASPKNIKKKEQVTPAVASSQEVKICMDNQETHPIPSNEYKRMKKKAHKRILCARKKLKKQYHRGMGLHSKYSFTSTP